MIIVGFDLIAALIARELRLRPKQGRTLDCRVAAWKAEVEKAAWRRPTDVKAVYGSADIIGGNRVVFDICGNSYRLVVHVNYLAAVVRVRFAGSHEDYDRIDATTV